MHGFPHALACLLACGSVSLCAANEALAQSPAAVPLCITDFPPYVGPDLPDGGSLGALARRAFNAAGLTVQFLNTPWARAFTMARKGECVLLALWRNDERDALFRYSIPVAHMQLGLFVQTRSGTTLPPNASVAFERGSYLPAGLTNGPYRLNPVVDMHPALRMLKLGRVDAVFSERASFEYLLKREQIAEVRWLPPAPEVKATYMAISRSHPQAQAWLELLNQEIQRSARN